jgi:carboxymethylenebutenolidase
MARQSPFPLSSEHNSDLGSSGGEGSHPQQRNRVRCNRSRFHLEPTQVRAHQGVHPVRPNVEPLLPAQLNKQQEYSLMSQQHALTAEQQKLNDLWDAHLRAEFEAHSADEAIKTMVANPLVNHVPVMTGGSGREEVYEFYAKHFLNQRPPDMEMVPVSRTIGQDRVVDEIVARFTHTIPMDLMLPGIPPTGKRVEIAFVVVAQFDGDKLAQEHLYWDQASVLVQLGLLEPASLPVVGVEGTRSVLDRSIPLNALIRRAKTACRGDSA